MDTEVTIKFFCHNIRKTKEFNLNKITLKEMVERLVKKQGLLPIIMFNRFEIMESREIPKESDAV